jgi:hypothetical protein
MSTSTKLLLIKRDYQLEYEQLISLCKNNEYYNKLDPLLIDKTDANEYFLLEKKLFLYHQVYSLYLFCINDIEKLLELNDQLLKEPIITAYHSKLVEFYLFMLNVLYFEESSITKFIYKTRLFSIIRSLIVKKKSTLTDSSTISCTRSFLAYLQISIVYFKLSNSSIFVSQLLENNDLDLLFNQISLTLSSSAYFNSDSAVFSMALIFTNLAKLEHMIANTDDKCESLLASNLGLQHQIRRQFDSALKLNPRSFQLWFLYLKFEVLFYELESKISCTDPSRYESRVMSIFYQSIRNLPNFKVSHQAKLQIK